MEEFYFSRCFAAAVNSNEPELIFYVESSPDDYTIPFSHSFFFYASVCLVFYFFFLSSFSSATLHPRYVRVFELHWIDGVRSFL